MKIATGYFSHETNTFSNLPTGLEEFKQRGFVVGTPSRWHDRPVSDR